MKRSSWVCTIAIQLALCCALYAALNLGHPQKSIDDAVFDLHFISVAGGLRSLLNQTHLLKLIESVSKAYKAKFVVQISEFGEEDPLLRNAIKQVPSPKLPWYTTRASKAHRYGFFAKHIKLPLEKSVDIVFLESASLEDAIGSSNGSGKSQLNWLSRTLRASNGDWRVVVGSHPLSACAQTKEELKANQATGLLLDIFTKYEVDVYLSKEGSTSFAGRDGFNCVSVPSQTENGLPGAPTNAGSETRRELGDGFFLHRVSALEMVSLYVNTTGVATDRRVVRKRGKDVM